MITADLVRYSGGRKHATYSNILIGQIRSRQIGSAPEESNASSAARLQEALASAAAHAERARVAELRGQLNQAQGQLTQVIHEANVAIEQVRAQAADLDDRLKASIASEREALARSSQQATSFASSTARYQQQLAAANAHDVRIRETLRSLRWPEANIHFLMSPTSSSSSSAVPGGNASPSSSHRPTSPPPGVGYTDPMYASSNSGGSTTPQSSIEGSRAALP